MDKITPSELAVVAVALYQSEHRTGDAPDDLGITDYFQRAYETINSAKEFLAARERESVRRPEPWQERAASLT